MSNINIINEAVLDGRRTQAAVFAVEHVPSGKRLIVSTKCLSRRLYDQQRYLAKREHYNPSLHSDLVRDGPDAFRFFILELVDDVRLLRPIKRHFVEEAQRHGLCYNVAHPHHAQRITVPALPAEFICDDRRNIGPALANALLRLQRWAANGSATTASDHPA